MKRTVYLPEELEQALASSNLKLNLSRLLQDAITKEITMHSAIENNVIDPADLKRIIIHSESEDRKVAFRGRALASYDDGYKLTVYLTRKGQFVVDDRSNDEYSIHPTFDDLVANGNIPGALLALVARAMGTEYVEDLDI